MKSPIHCSQLAGIRTHARTHTNPHTYSAGINPKFGWQPPTGSFRSSRISKHIRKGFWGQDLTAPERKELRHYLQNRTAHILEHWLEDRKYLLLTDILYICCTYGFRWSRKGERESGDKTCFHRLLCRQKASYIQLATVGTITKI